MKKVIIIVGGIVVVVSVCLIIKILIDVSSKKRRKGDIELNEADDSILKETVEIEREQKEAAEEAAVEHNRVNKEVSDLFGEIKKNYDEQMGND